MYVTLEWACEFFVEWQIRHFFAAQCENFHHHNHSTFIHISLLLKRVQKKFTECLSWRCQDTMLMIIKIKEMMMNVHNMELERIWKKAARRRTQSSELEFLRRPIPFALSSKMTFNSFISTFLWFWFYEIVGLSRMRVKRGEICCRREDGVSMINPWQCQSKNVRIADVIKAAKRNLQNFTRSRKRKCHFTANSESLFSE